MTTPHDALTLLDWKRRVFALYRQVRETADPCAAWERWRAVRDELFRTHEQTPLPAGRRASFGGVPYYPYDPAFRQIAELSPADPLSCELASSREQTHAFTRFATAHMTLAGRDCSLEVYWLDAYGGGVFVPFRDATSGKSTYGATRYLLDTVKGADLGAVDGRLILDFNFAYNPSCSYDPRWDCPLAPAAELAPRRGRGRRTLPLTARCAGAGALRCALVQCACLLRIPSLRREASSANSRAEPPSTSTSL